jgi:hypothetical protein
LRRASPGQSAQFRWRISRPWAPNKNDPAGREQPGSFLFCCGCGMHNAERASFHATGWLTVANATLCTGTSQSLIHQKPGSSCASTRTPPPILRVRTWGGGGSYLLFGYMNRRIVRCSSGGLFSTIWIPAVSLKAARLGSTRLQRCPIHHKWQLVKRVDPDTLTTQERTAAESIRDLGIP